MLRSRAATSALSFAAVLHVVVAADAWATTQSVHTKIEFTCSGGRPAGYDEFTTVRVELAGARLHAMLNSLPEGSHVLSVVPEPPAGGGWVVTEIKFFDVSDGSQQNFAPHSPEAQVTLRIGARRAGAVSTLTIGVDQCGGTEKVRLPVIFLPGVGGTKLHEVGTGHEVWPLAGYGNRFHMMLDRDGIGNAERIRTGTILRDGLANFYGDFVAFFVSKGYVEGRDFFTFPYDWRLDPDSQAIFAKLDETIAEALKQTGASKVVLAAHSLGGVISRAYLISRPAMAAKVDALVTMGTPYWGNVHPFYALVEGYDFGNPEVFKKTMKILCRNFVSPHFLIARIPFVRDEQGVELTREDTLQIQYRGYVKGPGGIDDYKAADGLIWNLNATLLERANVFWSRMGTPASPTPLPGGVKHYVVLGHGIRTFDGYRTKPTESDDYIAIGARKVVLDPTWGDGDITVPIWSSQIRSATQTFYIKFKAGAMGSTIGRLAPMHGDLTKLPVVQNLVWEVVRGQSPSGYGYIKPSWLEGSLVGAIEWVDFTLRSDAHLSIEDDVNGGRLGFGAQDRIEETLAGGTFLPVGEAEHATLVNDSNRYKVKVNGIRDGKFTLEIRIGRGPSQIAALSYAEVPVKPGTLAELVLIPNQAGSPPPVLRVTTDGRTTEVLPTGTSAPPPSSGGAGCAPLEPIFENDTNRYGGDYRSVELARQCPELCAEACKNDNRCKAWSFVRPGFESAGCWLKESERTPTANACCVSGTYTRMIDRSSPAAGAEPTPGGAAPGTAGTQPPPPSTGSAGTGLPPASGSSPAPAGAGAAAGTGGQEPL